MKQKSFLSKVWGGTVLAGLFGLAGCEMDLLSPRGQVGADEKALILTTVGLMLIVVVPVIILTLVFAWRFRASNKKATYAPHWAHSNAIEVVVWSVPLILIIIMGVMTWVSTHALDPYRPLASQRAPISVQVVALDWKWLFIYPDEGVAVVNELALPVDVPVNFAITSDAVMNSFFIPRLGSQVYAMAGMKTQLHLVANTAGDYDGMSANYSGAGFSGMKFKAHALSPVDFRAWIAKVKANGKALDVASYAALARPGKDEPVRYYATVPPGFFQGLLNKYRYGTPAHGDPGLKDGPEAAGTHAGRGGMPSGEPHMHMDK